MSIQWVDSFEQTIYSTYGGISPMNLANSSPGWTQTGTVLGSTTRATFANASSGKNTESAMPTNNGSAVAVGPGTTSSGGGYSNYNTYQRQVSDNDKLVVGGGCRIDGAQHLKQTAILSFGGANKLSFGLNGKFAALYVNDVLAATSSVDVITGLPWFYVSLFQSKSAGKVYLRINGAAAADVDLPSGHTTDSVIMDLGRASTNTGVSFSDIAVYDSIDPMGPLMAHEFFKTGTVVNQFAGSANTPNNRPFTTSFVSSETLGAEDRWEYSNILPVGVEVQSIKAVIQKAVAASGGVSGGSLNLRLRVGTTNYDTSVSSQLTSTTPVVVQKVWEVNPATSTDWTRSEVQAIQTGYVVAT